MFTKLFETAEIARFSKQDLEKYEDSVKAYRDITNAINTAKRDEAKEIASRLRAAGMDADIIAQATGPLSP